jgi:proline dehydrogenase
MSTMRNALLWASTNLTLADRVPKMAFVQQALRKFMPGEHLDDAIGEAHRLAGSGLATTFTHLGENVTDAAQADAVAEGYRAAYDRIAAEGLDTEISLKLTHLGLDLGVDATVARVLDLAAHAASNGNWLWIDMESSPYVEATIEVYDRARAVHRNVGICLQAYLHRSPTDVAAMLPDRANVRLVKGAYLEPPDLAVQSKQAVDDQFFALAAAILPAAAAGEARLALGTHDVGLIRRIAAYATAAGLPRSALEVQMLYGIRMDDQVRLAADGFPVRNLIAYGSSWYPWYVRRLAERPANLWFVGRNLLSRSTLE